MTSRPVSSTGAAPTAGGPGDRPHLPPVPASGSTSRRTDRKAPLAWLPWLLLGLLLLTLLATALLLKAADGTGASSGADSAASSQADAQTGAQGDAQAGGQAPGGEAGAPLSAGGTDLLAVPGGRVGDLAGERASGTARVESVVADEGFWVGSDATRRVFVFLTPEARRSAGESGFQVEAGQTVSVEGTVQPSSAEFAQAAGVTDAEGSRQLVTQGGFVEATEVRLAE